MDTDPCLQIARPLWSVLTRELHRRTEGHHEAGAFLLGTSKHATRRVLSVIYYDELDARAYNSGVCILHSTAFGHLWDRCAAQGLAVMADVHVHGSSAGQSQSDRENPMIARPGHIALILPLLARSPVRRWAIGFYEYRGEHRWRTYRGCDVARVLKIEDTP